MIIGAEIGLLIYGIMTLARQRFSVGSEAR